MNAGTKTRRVPERRRTAARLAAVQALYQMELADAPVETVINEFLAHRLTAGTARETLAFDSADHALFADLARGAAAQRDVLDRAIGGMLSPDWPLARLDAVLRAILRVGAYELAQHRDVPPEVTINEYVDIAHAFFAGKEPGLINSILDHMARHFRPDELGRPRASETTR